MRASDWRNDWIDLPGGDAPDLVTGNLAADSADLDAVAARLAAAVRLVGPEAGLAMRSVEVPPGSLVLAHRELFHRGGRAVEGGRPGPPPVERGTLVTCSI